MKCFRERYGKKMYLYIFSFSDIDFFAITPHLMLCILELPLKAQATLIDHFLLGPLLSLYDP